MMETSLEGLHILWNLDETGNPSREGTSEGHNPAGRPDSNQPAPSPQAEGGHESHEVMKELMAVRQELAKVNAELLIHRDSTEELAKVKAELQMHRDKMAEQEHKSKELTLEVEGLCMEVRGKQSNQQPSTNLVDVTKTFNFPEEAGDPSPKLDKRGIVRGGQEVYAFNESVWDSLVFLWHIQGAYEGVDMIILGMLNLMIQIFFCILLMTLDLADTGKEVYMERVNAFIQWRVGVAHQAEHYDPLTNSSLAQRVCLKYGGTVQSRRHQNDLQVATSYYDVTNNQLSELQGPGLLMLALALWMALILKEVIGILGFTRMLLALTLNGDGTTDLHRDRVSGEIQISSMSTKRAWVMLIAVVLPRLFIALMLGYVGIFYLRQTFSVEEIILNAMALGFVLEIDELLFHFLPAAARYLVAHVDSVPLHIHIKKGSVRRNSGIRRIRKIVGHIMERSRVLLIILVIVVIYFRFTIIAQIQDSMEISQLLLCEGNRQFIFKESRATSVMHLAETVDTHEDDKMDLPIDKIQDAFDAILQATGLCNILADKQDVQDRLELCDDDNPEQGIWCKRCPHVLSLGPETQLWKDDSLEHTISLVTATRNEAMWSLACEDRYTALSQTFIPAPMNDLLEQAGANFSAGLCQDMEQYCLDPNMQIREVIRIFCPQQCRCDHGTSNTIGTWFFDRRGCAPTCLTLVHSELTQLEADLVLGKEACVDRDAGLLEEQWRPYVKDVEREMLKRGWLYEDEGLLYASETVRGFFAIKTEKDMQKFVSTVLHVSNQPTVTVDGCTMQRVPIDLVEWAKQAGSICRWARIVQYVFGVNLCSHTILLWEGFYGFNALSGLCPLSCGVASCSQVRHEGEVDSNLDAWYNVMPWGQESHYNFDCDIKNLVCLEVEKFNRERWNWHPDWKMTISEDVDGGATVYSASLQLETFFLSHEKDFVCIRPQNRSSCYQIAADMDMSLLGGPPARLRWRITEVGTGQFLLMGSHGETHRACGLHWLDDLGVECKHGDTVSVMTSWHQMQVDAEVVAIEDANALIPTDPSDFSLQGTKHGMFAYRKALIQGGYNGSSIQVLYSLDVIGNMASVPFGSLALPQERAHLAGQGFAACLPSPVLSELRPDKELCVGSDFATMCSRFVAHAHCEMPLSFVRELFVSNDCESDLDGLSDDDTVAKLCPESCAVQATCSVQPRPNLGWWNMYYSSYYYTFRSAGCLHEECECMDPTRMLRSCWTEPNLTTRWNLAGSGFYFWYYYSHADEAPHEDREIGGSIVKDGTSCVSEETGFMPRSFPMNNVSDQWCYVHPTCLGSKSSLNHADSCAWRPAYDRECAVDRSYPEFCVPSPGPHYCWGWW